MSMQFFTSYAIFKRNSHNFLNISLNYIKYFCISNISFNDFAIHYVKSYLNIDRILRYCRHMVKRGCKLIESDGIDLIEIVSMEDKHFEMFELLITRIVLFKKPIDEYESGMYIGFIIYLI